MVIVPIGIVVAARKGGHPWLWPVAGIVLSGVALTVFVVVVSR